jgi:hypothetical protein
LAAGVKANASEKGDRVVLILTAGLAMWNMGVGYAAGLLVWYALRLGWFRV